MQSGEAHRKRREGIQLCLEVSEEATHCGVETTRPHLFRKGHPSIIRLPFHHQVRFLQPGPKCHSKSVLIHHFPIVKL